MIPGHPTRQLEQRRRALPGTQSGYPGRVPDFAYLGSDRVHSDNIPPPKFDRLRQVPNERAKSKPLRKRVSPLPTLRYAPPLQKCYRSNRGRRRCRVWLLHSQGHVGERDQTPLWLHRNSIRPDRSDRTKEAAECSAATKQELRGVSRAWASW